MTDITPDFNICLKKEGAEPVIKREYDIQAINSFLQEAYNIVCMISKSSKFRSDSALRMPAYQTSLASYDRSDQPISQQHNLHADDR